MRGTLLNSRDIATLNPARDVLRRVEDAAWRRSLEHFDPYAPVSAWDLGRLSEAASVADDAIFRILSTARTNCGVNITDSQLAGPERAQEQAVQPPAAAEPPEAAARQRPDPEHPEQRDQRASRRGATASSGSGSEAHSVTEIGVRADGTTRVT